MKDIAEWLASLDLGEYAQRFAENAIDFSVIRDLTENDLEKLGVLLGHRRKMLRAIAELQELVRAGLATAHSQRMVVGRRVIEIAHVKITEAGRRALTDKPTQ